MRGEVARIATGEVEDERVEAPAQQRAGGRARAEKLTPEERSEIAPRAAAARWGGDATIRYRRIGYRKSEED